jgi:hypothetical protein
VSARELRTGFNSDAHVLPGGAASGKSNIVANCYVRPSSLNVDPSRPDGMIPASPDTDTLPVSGRDGGPARPCARPASEGSLDESPSRPDGMIPASPDTNTSPVSGRDGGPARPCARSQGRGCARPASEGSLDESPSRLDGIRAMNDPLFSPLTSSKKSLSEAARAPERLPVKGKRQDKSRFRCRPGAP